MTALIVISCGRASDEKSAQSIPTQPQSEFTENQVPTTGIEADFAGKVQIDSTGGCQIVSGNDVELVDCQVLSNNAKEKVFSVRYDQLKFEKAPVCNINFIGNEAVNENIVSVDNMKMVVKVTTQEGVNPPQPVPHPTPIMPTPVIPRPPVGVCTPAYSGPGCISCCGSSYGSAIERMSGTSTAMYHGGAAKNLPQSFMFQCKILD